MQASDHGLSVDAIEFGQARCIQLPPKDGATPALAPAPGPSARQRADAEPRLREYYEGMRRNTANQVDWEKLTDEALRWWISEHRQAVVNGTAIYGMEADAIVSTWLRSTDFATGVKDWFLLPHDERAAFIRDYREHMGALAKKQAALDREDSIRQFYDLHRSTHRMWVDLPEELQRWWAVRYDQQQAQDAVAAHAADYAAEVKRYAAEVDSVREAPAKEEPPPDMGERLGDDDPHGDAMIMGWKRPVLADGIGTISAVESAGDLLGHAAAAIKQRAAQRDMPSGERSMARTVAMFGALTGKQLTETEGWLFMVALKMARATAGAHNIDDYVDMAAYAALAGEAAGRQLL